MPPHATGRCPTCFQPLVGGAVCARPICVTRRQVVKSAALGQARRTQMAHRSAVAKARTKAVRKTAKARLNAGDAPVAVAIVPRLAHPLEPLPSARRDEFLAHLYRVIGEAFESDPQENPDALKEFAAWKTFVPDDPLTLNASCIACEGSCCTQGAGNMAFITRESMTFQRLRTPDVTADALFDTYAAYIPEQSIARSCVYHGPQGCVMPRERRAKICNEWQCGARQALLNTLKKTGATHSVVMAVNDDHMDFPKAGADVIRTVTVGPDTGLQRHPDLKVAKIPKKNRKPPQQFTS